MTHGHRNEGRFFSVGQLHLMYVRENYGDAEDGVVTYELLEELFPDDEWLHSEDEGEWEHAEYRCEQVVQEALRGSEFVPRLVPYEPGGDTCTEYWFNEKYGTEYEISPQWESGLTPLEWEVKGAAEFVVALEVALARYPNSGAECMRDVQLLEQYGVKTMAELPKKYRKGARRRRNRR